MAGERATIKMLKPEELMALSEGFERAAVIEVHSGDREPAVVLTDDHRMAIADAIRRLAASGTRIYRHVNSDKLYAKLGEAEHTETGELLVIYRGWPDGEKVWARPKAMFDELMPNGRRRFEPEP